MRRFYTIAIRRCISCGIGFRPNLSHSTAAGAITIALVVATAAAQDTITFLNSWGSAGTGNGQFGSPEGITVGPTGTVYVTDASNARFQAFDRAGNFLASLGSGFLSSPYGIGTSSSGEVYVSDFSFNQVYKFTSSGVFETGIGHSFLGPTDAKIGPNGNLYVVDNGNDRIQELTPTGSFVTQWGSAGSALGQFSDPVKLGFAPNGTVYVSDDGNSRIEAFDGSGNFQTAWNTGPGSVGLTVNAAGQVYVSNISTNIVTKYDGSGNVLTSFAGPGSGTGQLSQPYSVAAAPTGEVYVADTGNNRVERWFDPDGWVSGTNTFTSAGVGSGQLLGTSQTLSSGKTLNVSGTTTINGGGTLALSGGTLSTGSLALTGAGASFQVNSGTYSIGSLSVSNGAAFQVLASQTFTTSGTTTVGSGGSVTVNGALLSSGVAVSGVLSGGGQVAGPLTNNNGGEVRVGAGQQLWFSSTSAHSNAGLIDVIGGPTGLAGIAFSGALTNVASTGLITTQGGGNLRFDAGLINNGSVAASFGQANVFGDVTNNASGKITIGAGANATFYGDVVQNGVLTIASGSTAEMFGAFSGSGGFTGGGTLRQDGDLRPGNSPALINLGGNLVIGASSTYHMELGGTTIGSQYDSIAVSNSATLGGTLEVDLINGFHPSLAQQFTALTFGSESGDFANYTDLAVGGHLTLRHAFVGNSLILTARPTVDGDINLDGVVNGLDIAAVSSHWLLSGSAGINGDANGDGVVNGLDIALIASNWLQTGGAGAGTGIAVPEPSAIILAGVGAIALLGWRRRRAL
jgi:hypothetical protein